LTDFDVIGHEVQWRGRILTAGSETYRYADGSENVFDKVWHPGAVAIVAVDSEHIWLVRQPREAAGLRRSLEIPAGKRDRPGEPLLDLARRELVEEIGKQASDWRELFDFYPAPGFSDERMWLLLATGISEVDGGAQPEEDEHIEIVPWPLGDLDGAIAETQDAKTLVALHWLARQDLSALGIRPA
jgi:8-oxo-dGTP pyrophosphatase MutT (NUDIX family)